MKTQIGWYDPKTERFCYIESMRMVPEEHKDFVIPVYATDEEKHMLYVLVQQSLRNQHFIMKYLRLIFDKHESLRNVDHSMFDTVLKMSEELTSGEKEMSA